MDSARRVSDDSCAQARAAHTRHVCFGNGVGCGRLDLFQTTITRTSAAIRLVEGRRDFVDFLGTDVPASGEDIQTEARPWLSSPSCPQCAGQWEAVCLVLGAASCSLFHWITQNWLTI